MRLLLLAVCELLLPGGVFFSLSNKCVFEPYIVLKTEKMDVILTSSSFVPFSGSEAASAPDSSKVR